MPRKPEIGSGPEVLGLYLKRPSRNSPQSNDLGQGASDTAT